MVLVFGHDDGDAAINVSEIDRLLTATRAVRRRLDLKRPVPREVIEDCIRLACYAGARRAGASSGAP